MKYKNLIDATNALKTVAIKCVDNTLLKDIIKLIKEDQTYVIGDLSVNSLDNWDSLESPVLYMSLITLHKLYLTKVARAKMSQIEKDYWFIASFLLINSNFYEITDIIDEFNKLIGFDIREQTYKKGLWEERDIQPDVFLDTTSALLTKVEEIKLRGLK